MKYLGKGGGGEPYKGVDAFDERFINLWVKDCPVKLDSLKLVPPMVEKGMYLASCDDKSGYDHLRVTVENETYLGV